MDIKNKKYKFSKKISPEKKLKHHYSKLICSILNKNEKKEKENIIHKDKKENGIVKIQNNNKNIKKIFNIKNSNKLKELIIASSHLNINFNNSNIRKDTSINKKNKIYNKKNNSKKKINKLNSEKNIKAKKLLHIDTYNNYKTIDLNKKNNKKETENKIFENSGKIIQIKNKNINHIQLYNFTNMNNSHIYKNQIDINSNNNNNKCIIKKNKLKKYYISSGLDLSRYCINKKKIPNKKNHNDKIYNNMPMTEHKNNNNYIKSTNNILVNSFSKNLNSAENSKDINNSIRYNHFDNIREINIQKKIFQKISDKDYGKMYVIDIKGKIKKFELNLSLNNSSSSGTSEYKKLRSFSKERDKKKLMNIQENELYEEKTNEKIDNLYNYIKTYNNEFNEKGSIHIKLIDKIRKNRRLKFKKDLYIKTE